MIIRVPKVGIVAVLAVLLYACGGGGVPEDATGKEIYVQVCARCHGEDLRGDIGLPLVGEDARLIDKPERYFVQSISAGIGRMPSFRGTLSDEQILTVTRYVMGQQGR